MTRRVLDAASDLVRRAAAKRPGEKQSVAIARAAKLLGISAATAENLFYREGEACSEERARQILAKRHDVLRDCLDFEISQTERHQVETERLLDELREERECQTTSETGLHGWLSLPRAGSVVSLAGSEVDSATFFFWGVAT